MRYVDGVLFAVPNANKDAFIAYSRTVNALFLECGATSCVDCWGDETPCGEITDFRRAVQAEADETVVFSWITWPDKPTRERGWEMAMADPRMQADTPFDGRRMVYGGFEVVVWDRSQTWSRAFALSQ